MILGDFRLRGDDKTRQYEDNRVREVRAVELFRKISILHLRIEAFP